MNLNYVRYADMARLIGELVFDPSIACVVGVPRSGMTPATMIATRINVPLGIAGCPDLFGGGRISKDARGGRILLVDDSVRTGNAMGVAKAALIKQGASEDRITTMALYAAPDALDKVDCYAIVVPAPRVFEWNMWNNCLSQHFMLDMDGVICMDPAAFDDDGVAYENALVNAHPKFVPNRPVHSIVTNRIERWRGVTEKWLKRHGVKYGELVMQPFDTAQERRESSHPAAYKAKHYANSGAWLFVESHDHIAEGVADLTKRPVLSLQGNTMFVGEEVLDASLAPFHAARKNWGNEDYTAPAEFCAEICRAAKSLPDDQMVVECGSGLTTTFLQQILPQERLMSLESDYVGHGANLAKFTGSLVDAPLESKGDYDWYTFPKPAMPVGLVVCDGPLKQTRGNRYGALPELHEYLAPNFTILMDDAQYATIQDTMDRWAVEYGTTHRMVPCGKDRSYAIVEGQK